MPAYLINHLREPGALKPEILEYLERVQVTLDPFGGRFIVQGGQADVLEGCWPGMAIVLSFPDMTKARAWYESDAYQEILHLRTNNVISDIVLVDGVAPDHTPAKFAQRVRHLLSLDAA